MIGPTATIISTTASTEDVIALIHDIIDRTATERDDDAFQIASSARAGNATHAFDYEIFPIEDTVNYEEEDLDEFEEALRGSPRMEVNVRYGQRTRRSSDIGPAKS